MPEAFAEGTPEGRDEVTKRRVPWYDSVGENAECVEASPLDQKFLDLVDQIARLQDLLTMKASVLNVSMKASVLGPMQYKVLGPCNIKPACRCNHSVL